MPLARPSRFQLLKEESRALVSFATAGLGNDTNFATRSEKKFSITGEKVQNCSHYRQVTAKIRGIDTTPLQDRELF
ncbi:MAG: hypothetical protein ACREWI_15975, partial [Telluria sp.]